MKTAIIVALLATTFLAGGAAAAFLPGEWLGSPSSLSLHLWATASGKAGDAPRDWTDPIQLPSPVAAGYVVLLDGPDPTNLSDWSHVLHFFDGRGTSGAVTSYVQLFSGDRANAQLAPGTSGAATVYLREAAETFWRPRDAYPYGNDYTVHVRSGEMLPVPVPVPEAGTILLLGGSLLVTGTARFLRRRR